MCYSSQGYRDKNKIRLRTIEPDDRTYMARSTDGGLTWQKDLPVTADQAGQGHGDLAVNGDTVLLVWPDIRGDGLHLRYSLFEDTTPQ